MNLNDRPSRFYEPRRAFDPPDEPSDGAIAALASDLMQHASGKELAEAAGEDAIWNLLEAMRDADPALIARATKKLLQAQAEGFEDEAESRLESGAGVSR